MRKVLVTKQKQRLEEIELQREGFWRSRSRHSPEAQAPPRASRRRWKTAVQRCDRRSDGSGPDQPGGCPFFPEVPPAVHPPGDEQGRQAGGGPPPGHGQGGGRGASRGAVRRRVLSRRAPRPAAAPAPGGRGRGVPGGRSAAGRWPEFVVRGRSSPGR